MNNAVYVTSVKNDNPKILLSNRPPRAQQLLSNKIVHNENEASVSTDNVVDVYEEHATIVGREHINNEDRPKVRCLVDLLTVIFNYYVIEDNAFSIYSYAYKANCKRMRYGK